MASNFVQSKKGLSLDNTQTSSLVSTKGDIAYNATTNKIEFYNGIVDKIVGEASSSTLTNKTLTGNTAVNLVSGSGTLILNTSGTITLPNVTDTIVGKATTDTLTNKSISGDNNTFINIALASLTPYGSSGQVLTSNGASPPTWQNAPGTGTVTSVALTAPGIFSVSGSPVTASGTLALSLATQSAGTYFSGPYNGSSATPTFKSFQHPTIQKFTSSSGTYTLATGTLYIRVRMVGAGGGGQGGPGSSDDTNGGNTTFGTSLLVANGGSKGSSNPPSGGTASLGSGPVGTAVSGSDGCRGTPTTSTAFTFPGGSGGNSYFGGSGSGGKGSLGNNAKANSGSGGGGSDAFNLNSDTSGNGGGAGGFIDAIIFSPSGSYAYSIGAHGTGGSSSSFGDGGGNGADGYIEVTEYYQ